MIPRGIQVGELGSVNETGVGINTRKSYTWVVELGSPRIEAVIAAGLCNAAWRAPAPSLSSHSAHVSPVLAIGAYAGSLHLLPKKM